MRYIGGKSLLIDNINSVIESQTTDISTVIDLFSGSGIVSEYFKKRNFRVLTNDFLYFSYVIQRGTIGINTKPKFNNLDVNDPIEYLNNLTIDKTTFTYDECFIYNNYSPVSDCSRMYFQPENALKIDVIRLTIEKWYKSKLINESEYFYLLSSLLNAVPYVSNITGVYAAYLKFWDKRTYNKLELNEPTIFYSKYKTKCFNEDYVDALKNKADLLYADPPYNSREYLPNYHILETIAKYDYPKIHGITGMRDYSNQKSVFCKKNTVESAFEIMIRDCRSRYILISYNNEGLISTKKLSEICQDYAIADSFKLFEYDYRRYKNKIPNNSTGLKEQLYFLRRY